MTICPACKRPISRNHITVGHVDYCDMRCYELTIRNKFNLNRFRRNQGGEYADLEQTGGGDKEDS